MRLVDYLGRLMLLTSAVLLSSCSRPPAQKSSETATSVPAPAVPAHAPSGIDPSIAANVGDPAKFREVVNTLKQAIQKHDGGAVASLVSYPIDINPHTRNVLHIATPAAFLARYDDIITPHIAGVIAEQKYDDIFVNAQGAMFGNGELWIAGICRDKTCSQTDIKIKTIQNTGGGLR